MILNNYFEVLVSNKKLSIILCKICVKMRVELRNSLRERFADLIKDDLFLSCNLYFEIKILDWIFSTNPKYEVSHFGCFPHLTAPISHI